MSDANRPPSPPSPNPSKEAFLDLAKKKRDLSRRAAAIQSQLRALDSALDALGQNARDDTIHLELTKDHAASLMATCWHYAAYAPDISEHLRDHINALGNFVFDAVHAQNAEFAQRVRRLTCATDVATRASEDYAVTDSGKPKNPRPPKKDCPYLRYSAKEMETACAESAVGSCYDYVGPDYARLHLSRNALVEMYRRPRRVKLVYAFLLQRIDQHDSEGCSDLFPDLERERGPGGSASRLRPYEGHSETEMLEGLKRMSLPPGQVKFAFGYLTVSLKRMALLHLYRSSSGQPGIAYLLSILDQRACATGR